MLRLHVFGPRGLKMAAPAPASHPHSKQEGEDKEEEGKLATSQKQRTSKDPWQTSHAMQNHVTWLTLTAKALGKVGIVTGHNATLNRIGLLIGERESSY